MKRILIAAAGLSLLAGTAWAHGTKSAEDTPANAPAKAEAKSELTGQVKQLDATARSLTIVTPTGDEQKLSVASDAKITRDGSDVGLIGVKEGDSVRASFDPKTNQASTLDVRSKTSTKY